MGLGLISLFLLNSNLLNYEELGGHDIIYRCVKKFEILDTHINYILYIE